MTDMWKIVTVTVVSEDGIETSAKNTDDNGGDVDATITEARDEAIERYAENIGSLDNILHRVIVQVVEFPEPKHRFTTVTATLGEEAAEAPVSFTAA